MGAATTARLYVQRNTELDFIPFTEINSMYDAYLCGKCKCITFLEGNKLEYLKGEFLDMNQKHHPSKEKKQQQKLLLCKRHS